MWYSNVDISRKNLNVSKGEVMPKVWQNITRILTLKKEFGEDAFIHREVDAIDTTAADNKRAIFELNARIKNIENMLNPSKKKNKIREYKIKEYKIKGELPNGTESR